MSSNIVTRVRYKKNINFQKLISGWCDYVSKDGADTNSLKDLSSINQFYQKEFGIFDNTSELQEHYIWGKNGDITTKEILKDLPKNKSGRMWNLIISFPPEFAFKNGLVTKEDYYLMTKSILPKFILDNEMDLTNTKWFCSYHRDTDNPHLHIAIFEVDQKRKKDTLEKTSLKYLKSNIASYLVDNTLLYKEQDYLFLGLENKIRKSNFTKTGTELFFSNKFRKEINKDLLNLYDTLPKRGRLQYNSRHLDNCRKDIDKIIEKILYHDIIKYEFEKYYHYLETIEREQKKIYGSTSNNHYVKNKINRLYSRIGNDILYNFKIYNSKEFLDQQKEFLKVNLLNMNFKSKVPKKESTLLKYANELYRLTNIVGIAKHDTKRILSKWLKNSNINYDVDLLYNAICNNVDDLNATDFYKALSHLGYTKERYDTLKSKSFYKNIYFKQFVKKANHFLFVENKKEERYLQEILEKELQGKDI